MICPAHELEMNMQITKIEKLLISPDASIRDAVKTIDTGAQQIVLVVDRYKHLLGTVTDGDIRRGILSGKSFDDPVAGLMNTSPLIAEPNADRQHLLMLMKQRRIHQIPVVDGNGVVIGIETINELLLPSRRDNIVVLMAGGLGSRLRPLTESCPKPMLPIGSRPILETILENFIEHGFHRFYISVNYKADVVKEYFGNGSRWGVQIEYLEEDHRLGTVGALTLLPETPSEPLFVMNGDILAKVNFSAMLDFHLAYCSVATLGVRQYSHTIPYGVVTVNGHQLVNIVEKPEQNVFVSAGIYLLSPDVLQMIPSDQYYDMPTLFQRAIFSGMSATGFPIHEYWIDIGRIEDFERASQEYRGVFE